MPPSHTEYASHTHTICITHTLCHRLSFPFFLSLSLSCFLSFSLSLSLSVSISVSVSVCVCHGCDYLVSLTEGEWVGGGMGWLRLLGSFKLQVSFAKEPYKRDDILQKRPINLRSLLIVATPYMLQCVCFEHDCTRWCWGIYAGMVLFRVAYIYKHTHTRKHMQTHTYTHKHINSLFLSDLV